jgi:glycerophosphoryl diester phosphodiesterase
MLLKKLSKTIAINFALIIAVAIISGCSHNRVLMEIPPFHNEIPEIATGFYTVHKINNGKAAKERGSDLLGEIVYLYKDDFFDGNIYFTGVKGSFLPDCYIQSKWKKTKPEFYWFKADKDIAIHYKIEFDFISENKIHAVFHTDRNGLDSVELRFYKHKLWDSVAITPIAHRGVCYQPPFNEEGIFPANTIPGFETALRSGYAGFELDVRITKDNRFIVSHDEDLNCATTARGYVSEKNLSEIEDALVIKSTAIPEKRSTAKEAYIAAPIVSLARVIKLFIDNPRLETMVVDIKPDTDERIYLAIKHDFEGLTPEQQKKFLFLTREESSAEQIRKICPYSYIALEGSIGPEPINDLKKYFPEAVGLPRSAHNAISFGSNILLAFESLETALKKIRKAMKLARQYDYKICMWTYSKVERIEIMRKEEIFPDWMLLDVPFYKYALEQMKYMRDKDLKLEGAAAVADEKKYKNPIYQRVYNEQVKDFWFKSSNFLDLTYGTGFYNHHDFSRKFAPVGVLELRYGRSEFNTFTTTNTYINDWNLFFSYVDSKISALGAVNGEVATKAWRVGLSRRQGFGYGGRNFSFTPYVSQSVGLFYLSDFSNFIKPVGDEQPDNDYLILKRFWNYLVFSDKIHYGFNFNIKNSYDFYLSYQTSVMSPRFLFWKWMGSGMIVKAGYNIIFHFTDKWVNQMPVWGPIINFIARSAYFYGFYMIREKDAYWPFDTYTPLRYEGFNFSFSYKF